MIATIYTDDFLLGGSFDKIWEAYEEIDAVLGFSPNTKDDEPFIGIRLSPVQRDGQTAAIFLDQGHLARALVERYKKDIGGVRLAKLEVKLLKQRGGGTRKERIDAMRRLQKAKCNEDRSH